MEPNQLAKRVVDHSVRLETNMERIRLAAGDAAMGAANPGEGADRRDRGVWNLQADRLTELGRRG